MIKTSCCNADIIQKHDREYPLGGRTWGINTVAPACKSCGEEHPETVTCCDICGEPAERLRDINGDMHCPDCLGNQLEAVIQELRERTGLGV